MGLAHKEVKWKSKGPSNKRIGMSSVEAVNTPSVNSIDSELGNTNLAGYAAKRPKQGRRM